jgi:hypothetical protein
MTYLQEMESAQVYLSRFPELNPSPVLACGLDGKLQYANASASQLLQALEVDNIDDILPIKHGGMVKSCLRTGTTLTEMRKVAGRTIVWSYRPIKKSRLACIYGYDISDFLPLTNGAESLPEANPNPVLSTGPDGVPQFTNPATSQLLQELHVKNVYDILPVDHKGLAKACLKTSTPLSKQRKVTGRTIVWSYRPVDDRDVVYIYGHDITPYD